MTVSDAVSYVMATSRLVVDVTPTPLPAWRAHVERDCVRLGTPITALRHHILRTVCRAKGRHYIAAARLNDEHEKRNNDQQQNANNDAKCSHDV